MPPLTRQAAAANTSEHQRTTANQLPKLRVESSSLFIVLALGSGPDRGAVLRVKMDHASLTWSLSPALNLGVLVVRRHACLELANAYLAGHRSGGMLVIASQHHND